MLVNKVGWLINKICIVPNDGISKSPIRLNSCLLSFNIHLSNLSSDVLWMFWMHTRGCISYCMHVSSDLECRRGRRGKNWHRLSSFVLKINIRKIIKDDRMYDRGLTLFIKFSLFFPLQILCLPGCFFIISSILVQYS